MGRFDGILICTDLDGTLLNEQRQVSDENIRAIEYFKSEGGYFTFVTGRMPFFVSNIYETVNPNAPFGCINGGGLYDHRSEKYIWNCSLSEEAYDLVEYIEKKFPNVGIQINSFHRVFFSRENETMRLFREITRVPNLVLPYREVTEPVGKIIFGSQDDEEILAIQEALLSHPLSNKFNFIRSERTLFEILPKGIGKGVAITKLVEHLNLDPSKTVAIGDYNNDISMFEAAGIGVAVANACEEAKAAADYITVSNDEHAIARLIYDIEKGVYPL